MGMIEDLKNCKSCAERREAIKKYMSNVAEWARHPLGPPPLPVDMPPTHIARRPPGDGSAPNLIEAQRGNVRPQVQPGEVKRFDFHGNPLPEEKVDKP